VNLRMRLLKRKRRLNKLLLAVLLLLTLCGCKKTTLVVLTTDFDPQEVFKIEDESCTVPEVMIYLMNTENKYSQLFGEKIWDVPFENGTVESQYKESVLARLAQIKAMKLFAKKQGIELSEKETDLVKKAAADYFSSLAANEIAMSGASQELIEKMYAEYAIANKVYESVTEKINPEISDDEARSITVKSILIKTYTTNAFGDKVYFNQNEKQNAYIRASQILAKINEGVDFDVLSADYNEDTESVYSFGRGLMPTQIEEAAYNLSEGQVSGIVETEYGYHILKCVSNFDMQQTDLNKEAIVSKRKEETFTNEYDNFISSLTSNLNQDLWESLDYKKGSGSETTSFFSTYDKYFSE